MAKSKIATVSSAATKGVLGGNILTGLLGGIASNASNALNAASNNATSQATPTQEATKNTAYLDIAKAYEDRAREALAQQEAALAKQLAASKQGAKSNYDSVAAQNYVNYMKQRNALPEQLKAMGINGGASESAQTRMMNNYALNQGSNEASRASALASLQSAYDTNIANIRQAAEERIADNNLALQQAQLQYDDTLAQRASEEARYREEVERAARERAEDIAREEARYKQEQKTAAKQYKDEQKWKNKEWSRYEGEKWVENYYNGLSGITSVDKLKTKLKNYKKKHPNWSKNVKQWAMVQAINTRIGDIVNKK